MTNKWKLSSGLSALASGSCLTLALAMMPSAAQAQDQGPPQETDQASTVPDIVVTARRREERVQDVPVVVSAIRAETVEKLNLREAKELVALVPGLDFRTDGYASSIQLRGLTFDVNSGALASVATYLNDAPILARALFSQLYDIGQVEVLHGPQGTLRGQASPSGSVTFTTKKPDLTEYGAVLNTTATTSRGYNINAALNLPIVKDVFGIRLAGVWDRNRNNRVRSIAQFAEATEPFSEEEGGRISVLFRPTDWLRLEGMYQRIDFKSRAFNQYASYNLADRTGPASTISIRPEDRLSIQESQNRNRQAFDIFNWQAQLRFAGQKIYYVGSSVKFKSEIRSNQDGANFLLNRDIYQTTSTNAPQISHEVRLQNEDRLAGVFDYVLGYYHTSVTANTHLVSETPVLLPAFLGGTVATVAQTPIDARGPAGGPPIPARETSFFGNLTAHIGQRLQISGGLRHVKYTEGARFLQIGANVLPNGPSVDDRKWIYTASVQYNLTPDAMIYFSTGSSRRRGPSIFQSALLQSPLQRSFVNLPSEDSKSYEVGLKSEWFDKKLVLNLTGFHQKFRNFPYTLRSGVYYLDYDFLNGGFAPKIGNSPQWGAGVPVSINGIEAELNYRPSPRLNFSVVAAYTDSKIKDGVIPCNDLNGDDVPDTLLSAPTVTQLQAAYGADQIGSCKVTQRASNQSPFSASVQAEYNHPISEEIETFGRGLLSLYGASKNDAALSFDDIGSYGLLNLYAGIRAPDGSWELSFFAKNVTKTVKYTRFGSPASTSYQELAPPTFRTTVGKAFTSAYSQIETTAPREFGVNLKVAIGSR